MAVCVLASAHARGDKGLTLGCRIHELRSNFEQIHIVIASVYIAAYGKDQIAQDRRAHGVQFGRNGIG